MAPNMPPILNGLGGTIRGSFFRARPGVDLKKLPGESRVTTPATIRDVVVPIATGRAFVYSPNLTWFLIALLAWSVAPYQLRDKGTKTVQHHFCDRLIVNHLLVFGYVGFWHASLYWWKWGTRPFVANRCYDRGRVLHNAYYTWLGVVQWTFTEALFLYGYQTNRIPWCDPAGPPWKMPRAALVRTVVAVLLLPAFRDVHFYFSHRMIHAQFLYKYVHSLHHRNTDVEPFAGLCMHPVEHLWYFTSYGPLLLGAFHPFLLFWVGVHLLLSPAAAHSGFEDHFSASTAHYLHHRHGDCNYGVPQLPLDVWFGTFRDRAKPHSCRPAADPKARLWVAPTDDSHGNRPDQILFNAGWLLLWWGAFWLVWRGEKPPSPPQNHHRFLLPVAAASMVSVGPVAWGLLLAWVTRPRAASPGSLFAPFDRDPWWALHAGLGVLLGVIPAAGLVALAAA